MPIYREQQNNPSLPAVGDTRRLLDNGAVRQPNERLIVYVNSFR